MKNNFMNKSAQPQKTKIPFQKPQNQIQDQIENNKQKIDERLREVKKQLEKIDIGLDNCDMIIANGNNIQVKEAKKKQEYLFKIKKSYDQYHDKLIKDSITIEALEGKFIFEAAEDLNKELDRIDEERQSIYRSLNQQNKQQQSSDIIEDKYTSTIIEELAQRSYKVRIPEKELDEQLLMVQDEITQRILNQIKTRVVPSYLDSITFKKK